jgi:hypothetical protein
MSKLAAKIAFMGTAIMLGVATSPAHAQSLDDKYWLEVSAYWASVDSSIRLEPKNATIPEPRSILKTIWIWTIVRLCRPFTQVRGLGATG